FVLISSDSDFTRLASRIREQGLDVYGIGQQKTPEAFRKACKRFIFVENILPETEPDTAAKGRKAQPSKAVPLIKAAMQAIDKDEEWFSLGQLGQFIVAANPDFDARNYGCVKLSELMSKAGVFELRKSSGNAMQVRLKP
ncbi:MAG: NYN domain-containing protein, partial [Natronohydrobacter sp.]|nr:NYN domain-containing protein [Natronohydrobacter sp.]